MRKSEKDGIKVWDSALTIKIQDVFDLDETGCILDQVPEAKSKHTDGSWEFRRNPVHGDDTIRALQREFGAVAHGLLDAELVSAIQKGLGVKVTGALDNATVDALDDWATSKAYN